MSGHQIPGITLGATNLQSVCKSCGVGTELTDQEEQQKSIITKLGAQL